MTRPIHREPQDRPEPRRRASLKAAVGAGFVLLLINTGYISAFASPTVFYMTNVLAHLVLGVALAVAFAVLLKRDPALRRSLMVPTAQTPGA